MQAKAIKAVTRRLRLPLPRKVDQFSRKSIVSLYKRLRPVARLKRALFEFLRWRYLFSIDIELEEELNKKITSEKLKSEFENRGFSLSENVTIDKKDDRWMITDGRRSLVILKEGEKLDIYKWSISGYFIYCLLQRIDFVEEDGVYKATRRGLRRHRGERMWYIPWNDRGQAMWAMHFMNTQVRYLDALRGGDVVIEAGAGSGEYTIPAARKVGLSGQIYAFEVEPLSYFA